MSKAILVLALLAAVSAPAQEVSREAVAALGSAEGKAQASGAVFIAGRFVAPPYTVSRRGPAIYVNRFLAARSGEWDELAAASRSKGKFLDEDGDFEIVPEGGASAPAELKAKLAALAAKLDAARLADEKVLAGGGALFFLAGGRAIEASPKDAEKLMRALPAALGKASTAKELQAALEGAGVYCVDPETMGNLLRHPLNARLAAEALAGRGASK